MTPRALIPCLLACLATLALPGANAQGLKPRAAAGSLQLPSPGSAPAAPGLRQADYIVAVVNSEPITNNEVLQRAARVEQQMRQQGVAIPAHELLMREVLERLVIERIQIQLAQENGIKVDDLAVDQAEASVARQNDLSVDEMHRRLQADGISPVQFRAELRNQLLAMRVREREVESRVRVTDLDIDQYLREHQQNAAGPQEINLGHILVAVPEDASATLLAQREERAKEAAAKLQAGEPLDAVARQYSDAPDAARGGLMGLRPANRYPELFVQATRGIPVGGVVGPLRSPAGFHLLKVVDRSQSGIPNTAIQNHARHILLRVDAGMSERQAAAQLQDLRQRIVQKHADFAQLAREYSQDGSAKDGGDLGWALPGRYVPEFEQALDALSPGEISPPVVSRFGVHLIQLLERREVKLTQREQRDMVRSEVREKKLDEAFATWMQEARARAYVEYREPPQ